MAGIEVLEAPGSPSSLASPYHTSTLWQEQGSHNTVKDSPADPNSQTKFGTLILPKTYFFLKLVMI